jgi:hypothetical protein
MKNLMISLIPVLFSFFFASSNLQAQSTHFIYIQSDDHQPFYVKINSNVFSSNEEGFVILSGLKQGPLNFTIGFPKNVWPASGYDMEVEDKDMGYQLKKMNEKNWALYQMTNGELLPATTTIQPATYEIVKTDDEFANRLADASHTPSIKEIRVLKDSAIVVVVEPDKSISRHEKEKPKTEEPVNEGKSQDSVFAALNDKVIADKAAKTIEEKILKKQMLTDDSGTFLEYEITTDGIIEKVSAFIPEIETENKSAKQEVKVEKNSMKSDSVRNLVIAKCSENAGEQDFLQLRRKLVEQESEMRMIDLSAKAFGEKCYTTMQVKNLAVLFLSNTHRLEFLQMVYPAVIDNQHYPRLESLFDDENFRSQFRAMLH